MLMHVCVFQGMSSVFFNKGENCIAAGRLFVEESIHDQFVKKVVCVSLYRTSDVSQFTENLVCLKSEKPPEGSVFISDVFVSDANI